MRRLGWVRSRYSRIADAGAIGDQRSVRDVSVPHEAFIAALRLGEEEITLISML